MLPLTCGEWFLRQGDPLERRRYLCWCKLCLHGAGTACTNVAFFRGEWETVQVTFQ